MGPVGIHGVGLGFVLVAVWAGWSVEGAGMGVWAVQVEMDVDVDVDVVGF